MKYKRSCPVFATTPLKMLWTEPMPCTAYKPERSKLEGDSRERVMEVQNRVNQTTRSSSLEKEVTAPTRTQGRALIVRNIIPDESIVGSQ